MMRNIIEGKIQQENSKNSPLLHSFFNLQSEQGDDRPYHSGGLGVIAHQTTSGWYFDKKNWNGEYNDRGGIKKENSKYLFLLQPILHSQLEEGS